MSILPSFFRLRPADDTPASISDALERAKVSKDESVESVVTALARRDGLLLDGTPDQVKAAEATLREARENVDRLTAMVTGLTGKLRVAKRAAIEAKVKKDCEDSEATALAVQAWWDRHLGQFRAMGAEGRRLTDAHLAAKAAWHNSMGSAYSDDKPNGYNAPCPNPVNFNGPAYVIRAIEEAVKTHDERQATLAASAAK